MSRGSAFIEMGSEYNLPLAELDIVEDNVFAFLSNYSDVRYYESGRSAIRCVSSRLQRGDVVLLPEFICESVIECFSDQQVVFYRIGIDFQIDLDDLASKLNQNVKLLFLMHYFGELQSESSLAEIERQVAASGCTVLEDATHSLFTASHTIGDYVVASIRKWMPVPHGGVLVVINDKLVLPNCDSYDVGDDRRAIAMVLKDVFLQGELDCNDYYRNVFSECEKGLDERSGRYAMSEFSRFCASCVSVADLKEKRKANYIILERLLDEIGIRPAMSLSPDSCPLCLCIRASNRDDLRSYLTDNRIYCAVHWPFDGLMAHERPMAELNGAELLSLPIDQRYGKLEMEHLASVLSQFWGDYSC